MIKRKCDEFNKEIGHEELKWSTGADQSATITRTLDGAQLEGTYDASSNIATFKSEQLTIKQSFTAVVINDDIGFSSNREVSRHIRVEDESDSEPEITHPEQIAKEIFHAFVSG